MLFVKVDELKPGMRLGKPIYNKNGVLLYDRDTKLTMQAIYGIKNFRLLGLYILEPAEPVPDSGTRRSSQAPRSARRYRRVFPSQMPFSGSSLTHSEAAGK